MESKRVHRHKGAAAKWRSKLKSDEEQRLEVITDRLERKQITIAELHKEKHKIMRRCIKRMRRAKK